MDGDFKKLHDAIGAVIFDEMERTKASLYTITSVKTSLEQHLGKIIVEAAKGNQELMDTLLRNSFAGLQQRVEQLGPVYRECAEKVEGE